MCTLLGSPITHSSDVKCVTFFLRKELTVWHERTPSREAMPPTNAWPVTGSLDKLLSPSKKATGLSPYSRFARSGVQTTWSRSYSFKHVLLMKIVGERLKIDKSMHHSTTGK